jgi:hypothetical protein
MNQWPFGVISLRVTSLDESCQPCYRSTPYTITSGPHGCHGCFTPIPLGRGIIVKLCESILVTRHIELALDYRESKHLGA